MGKIVINHFGCVWEWCIWFQLWQIYLYTSSAAVKLSYELEASKGTMDANVLIPRST